MLFLESTLDVSFNAYYMETFSEGGPTPQFGIWKLSHKPNLSHAIFQPILILE